MNDVLIIGGGIVGLATALKLLEQQPGLQITVIEKESGIAKHQTGNNSGVIHSGIYYQPGSMRARNCKRGYQLLLEYAQQHHIPFEICGKLIVATAAEEVPRLQAIYERGIQNGLTGLQQLTPEEFKKREPHVQGVQAIYVPQTGIIDYTEVAAQYAKDIAHRGGKIFTGEQFLSANYKDGIHEITTSKGRHQARLLVNCGGLYADKIAAQCGVQPEVQIVPFRGEYFVVEKNREFLVKHLIYPVPDPNFPFLGVHFTRFISGGVEAGPNAVLAYAREGYTKSTIHLGELLETLGYRGFQKLAFKYWRTGLGELHRSYSKQAFTKALQRLVPEIQAADLTTGGAGVRASATSKDGKVVDDFLIQYGERSVHVLNSPSPAATASLAIGEELATGILRMA